MQRHAADKLRIEVAHFKRTPARFAAHRKGFWQKLLERFASRDPLFKECRARLQLFVSEFLELRLKRIDRNDSFLVLLKQPLVTAAKNLFEKSCNHRL